MKKEIKIKNNPVLNYANIKPYLEISNTIIVKRGSKTMDWAIELRKELLEEFDLDVIIKDCGCPACIGSTDPIHRTEYDLSYEINGHYSKGDNSA